jgi:hypothetical protein
MTPQRPQSLTRRSPVRVAAAVVVLALASCGRARHGHDGEPDAPPPAPTDAPSSPLGLDPPPAPPTATPAPEAADGDQHAAADANTATANLRGYFAVDTLLRERLADGNQAFSLSAYLDGFRGAEEFGLAPLLGFSSGDGLRSGFRNGEANALSMVLWHMSLSSLAADVARICRAAPPASDEEPLPPVAGPFAATLVSVCKWPAAEGRDPATLAAFWTAVMEHDAPRDELDAFLAFWATDEAASLPSETAVATMLTEMFLNPYFLLRH